MMSSVENYTLLLRKSTGLTTIWATWATSRQSTTVCVLTTRYFYWWYLSAKEKTDKQWRRLKHHNTHMRARKGKKNMWWYLEIATHGHHGALARAEQLSKVLVQQQTVPPLRIADQVVKQLQRQPQCDQTHSAVYNHKEGSNVKPWTVRQAQ